MSADIEAIAKAWMTHQGYTPDDIEVAETDTHENRGCYFDGTSWYCFDEYGNSNHPAWDVLEEATEMARVAIEALGQSHVILAKEKAELRYYFCGHPAWPDPLMLWPPTLERARQHYEDSPHPNAWVGSCIEQQGLDVVFPKRAEVSS